MSASTISGYVDHIIFHNDVNGYTVLELASDGELFTLTGNLGEINEGEHMTAHGTFVTHPTYGEQFNIESYEVTEPEDLIGIERYLGSGAIKGIGPAMAARIVAAFKEDTLRIIDEEPERLCEIRGISSSGARAIGEQVSEKRDLRQALIYLQQYGISLGLAVKIYEKYGNNLYSVLQTNPYRLADDIEGVGFRIADGIAAKLGFSYDSDFRIKSGIYYALTTALEEGHVYLPRTLLEGSAADILEATKEQIEHALMDLVLDKKIIIKHKNEEDIVYASVNYYMEENIARRLFDLDIDYDVDEKRINEILKALDEEEDLEPDDDQRDAVFGALAHGVTVITGGPGTGKTTTINAIIRAFTDEGLNIQLAAPTGRAAKRMTEATGMDAKTIHRMLEFVGHPDESRSAVHFMRNEENPLDADVIIIDEMSMVDLFLMNALTKAIPVGARLIMVGDASQLPSVGPGNILRDLIESEGFHVIRLNRIFRQDDAGDIVINAHKINRGEYIDTDVQSKDFMFIKREDAGHVTGALLTLVSQKLPDYVRASSFDIQVLTPMRKGALGVFNLNKVLQQALNPPAANKREKEFAAGIFRTGDKVMQIKNNYQLEWEIRNKRGMVTEEGTGVFNGDIGIIREMNLYSEEIVVEFDDGKLVTYPFTGAEELELAYAITVHKSQGSEYPAVVIPLLTGPRPLMNRNLIYTAVTRAKTCVCIVGLPDTFTAMVENNEEQMRYSGLDDRIREIMEWKKSEF